MPSEASHLNGADPEKQELPKHLYTRLPKHALLPDGTPDYTKLALTSRVYELVQPTPLTAATNLSDRLGCQLMLKREDLQPVFSFKLRGAYNLMSALTDEERWRGVIACSAGNHAQGVALAGSKLGIASTIVMPLNTPSIKWSNVQRLGAKVVLHGNDFDAAKREAFRLSDLHGLTMIPPYDDPYVVAGQGTTAVEILRQTDPAKLDAIFVSVGGGGLLAGTLAYVRSVAPPNVKVIAVETHDGDALKKSLEAGQRVVLPEVGLFSDGTAVKLVGEEPFRIIKDKKLDDHILVSNDEICAAIKDTFGDTRSVPEPAGALSVAGMKKYIQQNNLVGSGKRFVSIVSGANLDFDRLRFVADRADVGEQKEAIISVNIPESPGAFVNLYSLIFPRAVTAFSYRYANPKQARVICSFYLSSNKSSKESSTPADTETTVKPLSNQELRKQELQDIMKNLQARGMQVQDLSDNELAKDHARYLGGGRRKVPNERVFSFTFPERPGALGKFLNGLYGAKGLDFNISLFNYRNYGGDVAKIFAGIQVPSESSNDFEKFLHELGYNYTEETNNPVYQTMLVDDDE